MSERTNYPAGVPCWVDTLQPDPAAAMTFYQKLFGWGMEGPGGDPPMQYYVARVRDRDVAGLGSQVVPGPATWNTYVRVQSADDSARAVTTAGGTVLEAPFDVSPAGRMAVVRDPAGAIFCLWEAGAREGAQVVNESRAWSMSALLTHDPKGAGAFYGAVFGWQSQELPFGDQVITLFRLPGYVGGEPAQPVPRDVVAVMMSMPAGTTASWSVDFWIDDADAATATASTSGATIVAPPQDGGGFRRATIADPQGATFSVSQLLH